MLGLSIILGREDENFRIFIQKTVFSGFFLQRIFKDNTYTKSGGDIDCKGGDPETIIFFCVYGSECGPCSILVRHIRGSTGTP